MTFEEFKEAITAVGFDEDRTLQINGGRFFIMPTVTTTEVSASYLYIYLVELGEPSDGASYACTIKESDAKEFQSKLKILISWLKPEVESFHKRMIERLEMFKNTGKITEWN